MIDTITYCHWQFVNKSDVQSGWSEDPGKWRSGGNFHSWKRMLALKNVRPKVNQKCDWPVQNSTQRPATFLVQATTGMMGRKIQWFYHSFTVVMVHDGALGQIPHLLHLPRPFNRAYHVSFLSRELKFEHIKRGALNIEYNIFSSLRKIQFK